jgi:hypothetical protein
VGLNVLRRLTLLVAAMLVAAAPAAPAALAASGPGSDGGGHDDDPQQQEPSAPPSSTPPVGAAAAELGPLEQAIAELGRAKRGAATTVARLSRRSAATLRPCLRGGPGWKKIKRVKHAPQRALYAASARRLLADMRLLIDTQQSRIVAYDSAFERFVARLKTSNVSNPLLREAIAAQARRVAAYRDVRAVKADCRVFNKLTSRVREFPTRTAAQIVRADYRTAPIARRIQLNIANQLRAIDRRHGISYRDADTLADAAEKIVELGGNPGYATGFQYALSLR